MSTSPFPFKASGRLVDFMRQADEPGLVNLAAGVPGVDALPVAALGAAFHSGLSHDGGAMLAYQHPHGDRKLRELVAGRLAERGASWTGEDLVMTTGCTQALHLLLTLSVKPGDAVAFEAPAYYGMLEILSSLGARALPLPLAGADGIDLDLTEPLLREHRPAVLVVCSTLSNPSGATLPEESRGRLVALCRELGIHLIDDDIYGELLDGQPLSTLAKWDPEGAVVSYASSFCKSVAPGLRVGVCAPVRRLFEPVAELKCRQDLHSAVVAEVALREFLSAGAMDPHLEWLRGRNRRRRELVMEVIQRSFPQGSRLSPPAGGYMLWVEFPQFVDLARLRASARERGIVFAAGTVFFAGPAPAPCVRLNCAKASEADLLAGIETLGRLACAQNE